jgi:hypothetical protein
MHEVHLHGQADSSNSAEKSVKEGKDNSFLNESSESIFAAAASVEKVQYTVNEDKSSPKNGSFIQALHSHLNRKSSSFRSGIAVTGLTSLSSQYVGPIGVGTVVVPSTCELRDGQALEFIGDALDSESNMKCHLEHESQIWVVMDTGSTNIWVTSDLCRSGACVKEGRHRYNHSRSATSAWPQNGVDVAVQFGTGSIKGPQINDDFHIGPFTVFNQTFGMIEHQDGNIWNQVLLEGVLGLSFPAMAANGVKPFFDSIIEQNVLVHNEFSFYFSVDSVTANAVFWGGVDPIFHEGPIRYFPVIDPYYWAIELLGFKVGSHDFYPSFPGVENAEGNVFAEERDLSEGDRDPGEEIPDSAFLQKTDRKKQAATKHSRSASSAWKAIVDTGTTFFTAEGDMYDEIMDMLPPVKCEEMTSISHPPITYRLRSNDGEAIDFVMENNQYMTSGSSDPDAVCSPAFMRIDIPQEHGPALILGECFLRHYYAVFNRADGQPANALVGFAKSRHDQAPVQQLMHLTRGQQSFQLPKAHPLGI